jgi:hypothetical protein
LENPQSCNNTCIFCIPQQEYLTELDTVIDMRNSQNDFNTFCKKIGLPVTQLKMENKSKNFLEG